MLMIKSEISSNFLPDKKLAGFTPIYKKKSRLENCNCGRVSLLSNILKILEKFQNILKLCFWNSNVVFDKNTVPKTVFWPW